ncbi:hypothetical protein ES288_D01G087600v1 [Gossypium darwinii]|uniref:Uncharacterized protein n=1 Tax=Gossypium darwinii TaxID=34276 RepID=A0A5D2DMZ8_GOSDA|nr:hypothetical protein ES288_D01G087600v1 [Gossypium darwinii]
MIVGRDDGCIGSGGAVGVMGGRGGGPRKWSWRLKGRNRGTRATISLGRSSKIAEGGGSKYAWLLLGDNLTRQKD